MATAQTPKQANPTHRPLQGHPPRNASEATVGQEAGSHSAAPGFRGPFSDGVPEHLLDRAAPPLNKFGFAEATRALWCFVVIVANVIAGVLTGLVVRRQKGIAWNASYGMVNAFIYLGPTFVKAGQIIASSPSLFPPVMSEPAQRCLEDVPPFGFDVVEDVITTNLGAPISTLFSSFDKVPLSAASVGQVHACRLPDGRDAVVKIQRPDISARMNTDLRILRLVAAGLMRTKMGQRAGAMAQIEDLHRLTNQELNTPLEAHRQDQFRSKIHYFGDNWEVTAPEVYWDYCGPNIICMERLYGFAMGDMERMEEIGFDARGNLRRGMKTWLEAVAIHGPFHGDLHAGNIWSLYRGETAFLDFGIMGEFTDEWKQMVIDILKTVMIDGDFTRIVRGYKKLGILNADVGSDEQIGAVIQAMVGPVLQSEMKDLQFSELFSQSLDLAGQMGDFSSPKELTLLGKQFLYFERYVKAIAPDYVLVRDPYLIKNILPEEAAEAMAKLEANGSNPDQPVDPDAS